MVNLIKLFCGAGLSITLLCLVSCEQKPAPMALPPQVKVVKKSIDLSKRAYQKKSERVSTKIKNSLAAKKGTESPNPSVSGLTNGNRVTKTGNSAESTGNIKNGLDTKSAVDAFPMSEKATTGPKETDGTNQKKLAAVASELANSFVIKKYDTMGRVDPFVPLLNEKTEESVQATPEAKKPKRILTPLEKMEVSQLKLVAVVKVKGRHIAMVEESSGKGYEVVVGTYMGRHQGRVSEITRDGILIKEYVKNFKGVRKERIQEIKFHKDEGGE